VRAIKNTTKFNTNTIGFYAIKGNSVNNFLDDSKAPPIAGFLNDIKISNNSYRAIVAIIDNFSSHKSRIVKQKAKELEKYHVYPPRYSPDLNPIEFYLEIQKKGIVCLVCPRSGGNEAYYHGILLQLCKTQKLRRLLDKDISIKYV
jgi:hypothetical protein